MSALSRSLLNWGAYGVYVLILAWVVYRYIYQPFAQGDTFQAVGSAIFIVVLFGIGFFARRKAEAVDFRRR